MSIFGDLQKLRERPIPAATLGSKQSRQQIPIDIDGKHNAEPLVAAGGYGVGGENFYAMPRNPPYYIAVPGAIEALLVRRSVAENLSRINQRLAEAGLELHVFDAWRPQAVQRFFHDQWVPRELRKRRPELSDEEIAAETGEYWAAPTKDATAPSPHSTGGAVDLSIRWQGGDFLWMGSLFDDASAISHAAHFESAAGAPFSFSADEARANRRLLYWLMIQEGFASNPNEWWHFSYGDQTWAQTYAQPKALYAGIEAAP
jgi:D-alanyl-D-alanine dipeptidase